MQIVYSDRQRALAADPGVQAAVAGVSEPLLRRIVETIASPRHYHVEAERNRWTARWIADQLAEYGYETAFQGKYANVVAVPRGSDSTRMCLVGAHYDTVPGTPGADDNGSAVASLLECARVIAGLGSRPPVCFVAFNREEDGLLGGVDFVENYLPASGLTVSRAHVLEMVGYCRHTDGSQRVPEGLPIRVPTVGDFLGVVGNRDSVGVVDEIMVRARTYCPGLPAIGLKVLFGAEGLLPVLSRSDHDPFWRAGIPAVMWTDTAEYRNPNYHLTTDTPDSLDYDFLRSVTQLLVACVLG